ncbi:hypothetical protein C8Q75DRAFT_709460 [Abortiporus biennis]|nr:hypothetical protein C8Q75DRAFT_709460 [Abortiporus biennis]
MGTTQSIFYPDNQYRLKRAQQLANDCKYAQQQYTASKARIENTLGPYKEKLDKLLQAFGCENIDELDRLVLRTATGDALEHWNRVRKNYDTSQIFDQVIMGAEAAVTIVGLTASAFGALAGGIGFLAGLGITTDALLVLGVIGALYDIINGAVQRDQLRSAICKLIPARLEAKYAQVQMEELESTIPTIKAIYHTYEELGYDTNKIMEKFKDHTWLNSLRTGSSAITYRSVGEELSVMDYSRKSWTNEDTDWRAVATLLQWKLELSSRVPSVAAFAMSIPNEGGCEIPVASMAGFATQSGMLERPQGNALEIPEILASHNMMKSSISQGIVLNKAEGIPVCRLPLIISLLISKRLLIYRFMMGKS